MSIERVAPIGVESEMCVSMKAEVEAAVMARLGRIMPLIQPSGRLSSMTWPGASGVADVEARREWERLFLRGDVASIATAIRVGIAAGRGHVADALSTAAGRALQRSGPSRSPQAREVLLGVAIDVGVEAALGCARLIVAGRLEWSLERRRRELTREVDQALDVAAKHEEAAAAARGFARMPQRARLLGRARVARDDAEMAAARLVEVESEAVEARELRASIAERGAWQRDDVARRMADWADPLAGARPFSG